MKAAAAYLANRYPFVNELLTTRLSLTLTILAALVLSINLTMFADAIATSNGYVTKYGPVIGGDFVVFDTAAEAAKAGDAEVIYDAAVFSEALGEAFPGRGEFRLSWQYPPTMLLAVSPLSLFPYLSSYLLWALATGLIFFLAIRSIWENPRALFLALAAPAAFQSVITGQTGFLTGGLLAAAAFFADRRPLLAGLAAGLLTMKPQLGLLLPIALVAAGCWRAFGAAALTACILAMASIVAFGTESWSAFAEAVTAHGGRMQSDIFPYHKLTSVFGGAILLGAPAKIALGLQIAASLTIAAIVGAVWRAYADPLVRVSILCAGALLVTPYAFYYEIALLIPPMLALARLGAASGWLAGERLALLGLWIAPMGMPGPDVSPTIPYTSLVALAAFVLTARRAIAGDSKKLLGAR